MRTHKPAIGLHKLAKKSQKTLRNVSERVQTGKNGQKRIESDMIVQKRLVLVSDFEHQQNGQVRQCLELYLLVSGQIQPIPTLQQTMLYLKCTLNTENKNP